MDLIRTIEFFEHFCGADLTSVLAATEEDLRGKGLADLAGVLTSARATGEAAAAAWELKRVAGQVNVAIHALGILLCLPHILEEGETIESASLGAGNTGKLFDLETNRRVAEFKFIQWRGGSESIRQNSLFKDFFLLAEHETPKKKHLYVLGREQPLKFLRGGRALKSVLKDAPLRSKFYSKYGTEYAKVKDYFEPRKDLVAIEDVSSFVSGALSAIAEVQENIPAADSPDLSSVLVAPNSIDLSEIMARAEDLNGKRMETYPKKKGFLVSVREQGLVYEPESTERPRRQTWKQIGKVIERYNQRPSLKPAGYRDITRHASYILPVLRRLTAGDSGSPLDTTDALGELREKVVPVLRPYVSRIELFGSLARGQEGPDSDVDLLVELRPSGQRPPLGLRWFGIEHELSQQLGRRVEMATRASLDRQVLENIEPDRIVLYEER